MQIAGGAERLGRCAAGSYDAHFGMRVLRSDLGAEIRKIISGGLDALVRSDGRAV